MNDDKILVEIASYCDPDLLNTVTSALKQADNPDRVFFSICYQGDNLQDYNVLKRNKHCKIIHLKSSETKGPCYARYLCQKMLDDEKYVFQIDSHMRFIKHWDTEMINQLLSLGDNRATISFYPPPMSKEMEFALITSKLFEQPSKSSANIAIEFQKQGSYFIQFSPIFSTKTTPHPLKSPFIAAGNFFSFANAHREVLHDPEMCWYGDELPMSIRLYTYGWNNYCPDKCYIYHKYYRKNRAIPITYAKGYEREKKKLKKLLNLDCQNYDMGEFGLGKKRTLKQFEEYSGIDFKNKLIRKLNS